MAERVFCATCGGAQYPTPVHRMCKCINKDIRSVPPMPEIRWDRNNAYWYDTKIGEVFLALGQKIMLAECFYGVQHELTYGLAKQNVEAQAAEFWTAIHTKPAEGE